MKVVTTLLLIAIITMPAYALMQAYSVEPVKASWSGRVWGDPQYGGISQTITCNFDSLKRVELFAGEPGNMGNAYRLGTMEDSVEVMWSSGTQDRDHSWVRFENWNDSIAFTKGKVYEFK